MLLSDRDIRAQIDAGRVVFEPWDQAMLQPSSVDVRLDKFFRLFDNHKYRVIDPAVDQPDLTRLVEVDPDDAFILHPHEFVLASTLEAVTLPDDIAAAITREAEAILSLTAQLKRPEWRRAIDLIWDRDVVYVTGFQTIRGLAEDFARRPLAWLDLISRNEGTTLSYSPTFGFDICARRISSQTRAADRFDLSRWRVAGNGADMIRPDVMQNFVNAFAEAGFKAGAFLPSYGLAEATLYVCVDAAEREPQVETFASSTAGQADSRLPACGWRRGRMAISMCPAPRWAGWPGWRPWAWRWMRWPAGWARAPMAPASRRCGGR